VKLASFERRKMTERYINVAAVEAENFLSPGAGRKR